ncbi:MAG TPA: N-formylglutamate deformylase [Casimicrobiaceae bacterium]|nr:N-formylglutamate deformylase [Casimicrobiaceae bacterium]
MLLWRLECGDSPLIVSVPHAGRHVPDAIALRMTPEARALPDTDWHVDELYRFAPATGATLVVATHSRYVVDCNRDPSGAALYADADNTELCPTRTFANDAIYVANEAPSQNEIAARRATFFEPWHACVSAEIQRVRARHGYAVLLDGHSIAAEVPRFFAGRLPDLNLGTADGRSCAASLQALAAGVLAGATRFSHVVNGRFKGGYVTRSFGAPHAGVHALQLEMVQDCYMNPWQPTLFDPARARTIVALLERLVIAVSEWRP